MKPAELIQQAARVGVTVAVSPAGGIKAGGEKSVIDQLIPILRENKTELIRYLRQTSVEQIQPKPFIINDELRIPVNCEKKYKWWAGGQSILETLLELAAIDEVIEAYIGEILSSDSWRRWQNIKKFERHTLAQ